MKVLERVRENESFGTLVKTLSYQNQTSVNVIK